MELKKLCVSRVLWTAITASFAFTVIMFNVTTDATNTNTETIRIDREENARAIQIVSAENTRAIQIVQEDVKKILEDIGYVRGVLEYDRGN